MNFNAHQLEHNLQVIPALKTRGVSEEDIRTIFVENPKRLLSGRK